MADRITNEQREAIVRKAVADRDALLSPHPADPASTHHQPGAQLTEPIGHAYAFVHSDGLLAWGFAPAKAAWDQPMSEDAKARGIEKRFPVYLAHPSTTSEGPDLCALCGESECPSTCPSFPHPSTTSNDFDLAWLREALTSAEKNGASFQLSHEQCVSVLAALSQSAAGQSVGDGEVADTRCPACLGAEFPGWKRGMRCATCNGTATVEPTPQPQSQSAAVTLTKDDFDIQTAFDAAIVQRYLDGLPLDLGHLSQILTVLHKSAAVGEAVTEAAPVEPDGYLEHTPMGDFLAYGPAMGKNKQTPLYTLAKAQAVLALAAPAQPVEPMSGWISIDERVPDHEQTVFIAGHAYNDPALGFYYAAAHYHSEGMFYDTETGDDFYRPTHWMEIVEPALLASPSLGSQDGGGEWISVDERLPGPGVAVLAFFRNKYGHGRTVRAHHAPKHAIEASHWEDAETDDTEDGSFEPEGWYEDPAVDETLAFISEEGDGKVTHWQPLPAAPKAPKGGE